MTWRRSRLVVVVALLAGCGAPVDPFVVPPRPSRLAPPPPAPAEDPRARALLDDLRARFLARPFYAVARLHVRRGDVRRDVLLRLHHRGPGHALVRADRSAREQGMTALARDGNVTVWFPQADLQLRLPPSLGADRLLGSDLTYDDLLSLGGELDGMVALDRGTAERAGEACHHVVLVPGSPRVSLADEIHVFLAVSDGRPVAQETRTRHGELVRSIEMERGSNPNVPLPIRWTARTGTLSETTLTFVLFEFDPVVDPGLFTTTGLSQWR